jgi:hypothetical protein
VPCVNPDGKPSATGVKTLTTVSGGAFTPPQIAAATEQPMFRVRSGLRELVNAGFLTESEGKYQLTETGKNSI